MGFLNGAYGKLLAGSYVRNIQYSLTRVSSRLRRVTRQVGDMEKQLQRMQKQQEANLKSEMQAMTWGMMAKAGFGQGSSMQSLMNVDQQHWNAYTMASQEAQMAFGRASAVWEQTFEMMREAQLAPLKDEEEALQTEKENLESRLKIATEEYEAKKKEEDAGAKTLVPNYTGQG